MGLHAMETKVILGDCLEKMRDIGDSSIDCIITDLPYGTTSCKWDVVIPFDLLWASFRRIIKKEGAILIFGSEPFSSYLRLSNIKMYKYDWYWNKGQGLNFVTAKYRPLNDCETISVFGEGKVNYYPIMEEAKGENIRPINKGSSLSTTREGIMEAKSSAGYDPNKRYPKTTIHINSREKECNSRNRLHPTQKPLSLLEYLITTYTKEGDVVLDSCCGSGTTPLAAKNLGRGYIGIEKDPIYYNITLERLNNGN